MIKNKIILSIFYSIMIIMIFLGCKTTINPEERFTLNGSVRFYNPDISTPDNVFIWVDGLEQLNTFTDINGNFSFQLDGLLRGAQGKTISATYPFYYFLGNYKLEKDYLRIDGGEFLWHEDYGIDQNGKMRNQYMQKLLDISLSVQPSTIQENYIGNIEITISLENVSDTASVILETYKNADNSWASIIFNPQGSQSNAIFYKDSLSTLQPDTVDSVSVETIIIHADDIDFTAGVYEIIPYLRVNQGSLPDGLINCFGDNADSFHQDYLNIPFKRESGTFTVTE